MLDIILKRRSIREFSDKEIAKSDLLDLVKCGFMAPSARAQESRGFVIIDDKEILNKLSEVSIGAKVLARAKAAIAVICPNVDSLTTPDMALEDLAAATENILLAATSKQIGSCWIGIAPNDERIEKTSKILNLDNVSFTFSLIALGYPLSDDAFYIKDKVKENLIYWNKVE